MKHAAQIGEVLGIAEKRERGAQPGVEYTEGQQLDERHPGDRIPPVRRERSDGRDRGQHVG